MYEESEDFMEIRKLIQKVIEWDDQRKKEKAEMSRKDMLSMFLANKAIQNEIECIKAEGIVGSLQTTIDMMNCQEMKGKGNIDGFFSMLVESGIVFYTDSPIIENIQKFIISGMMEKFKNYKNPEEILVGVVVNKQTRDALENLCIRARERIKSIGKQCEKEIDEERKRLGL